MFTFPSSVLSVKFILFREIYSLQRNLFSSEKLQNTHLKTEYTLKTELDMEKGFKITYLIGNSLPLHLKRVQFTLLIALKWFRILLASFPLKIRRMHAVYKIYVTVVLTFLQRSSRIHMFFFYDSPKGKKKN